MAALPSNFVVVKNAVMLNKRKVQAREWRNYLKKNWNELTQNLHDATILILAGRHGNEDGTIGPVEEVLIENHEKQVNIVFFLSCSFQKSLFHYRLSY